MQDNILVAVLLSVTFVTPVFAWLFYLWYRSHVAQMHQEGQIFDRRNRDRAHANYEPANGAQNPIFGPYFTPRGWVRPKTRGLSHVVRPPQYVPTRQPVFTGNPNSDQHFQGPTHASSRSPQRANQQPDPLSKRQQRKQRALQNRQRQQQQSQNEQPNTQNRQNQHKQKFKNQGQNSQKSPNAHSPNAHSPNPQGAQNEQYHQRRNGKGQNDQTSNHGGDGWGNDAGPQDNQHSAGKSENNNSWGSNSNDDQGRLRNSRSFSPQRGSRDTHSTPRERSSQRGNQHDDDHRRSDGRREINEQQQHNDGWSNSRPASPDQASSEVAFGGAWGQSDHGGQETSYPRSNHPSEDHNRYSGWGDDDTKSYTKRKGSRYGSPERKSRGRSSPSRDCGNKSRNRSRSNSWGREEEHRGGGSPTWGQDGNVYRDKKKKKERWEIELEENAKRRRSRSASRERSGAGWDKRSQRSSWKETQEW